MESLPTFLDSLAAVGDDAEAITWVPEEKVRSRLTWAQLVSQSRTAARRLLALGAGKGTRVGLLCSNRIEWLPLAFGAFRIGAILVPFSTLWKRDEIAYGLHHGDVEVLLTLSAFRKHDYLAALDEIVPAARRAGGAPVFTSDAPALRHVVTIDGSGDGFTAWENVPAAGDDAHLDAQQQSVAAADTGTNFFTSGTTAQAKAVVHCQGALALSARRLAACFGIGSDDCWWGHMPLFWSGGFVLGALATLAGRGRILLHEQVEADAALRVLERERCTLMAGWHQAGPLLEHPRFDREKIHLRKGTYHALAQRLMGPDHRAIGVYGMSETATCVTAARWDDPEEVRIGSFGVPLDGMELRIVDPDTGAEAEIGASGEILVKGPTLMEGYYKVPRDEVLDANGYFRTGDLGYLDERGALHFANRLKDVIKTAGVNVAAVEVEEALTRHASVAAAYVVGVPDPVRGENIAAWVVPATSPCPDAATLRAFCRESLAAYKVPRHVLFLADGDIPRTGTGKIAKGELRQLAAARVAATNDPEDT